MNEIPTELREERDNLVETIYKAFDGVTREGGVSWSQADVLDGIYNEEKYQAAGRNDTDGSWHELVGSEMFWCYASNWSFLDPIGFRYYLAPYMVSSLRTGQDDCDIEWHLSTAHRLDSEVKRILKSLSLMDENQLECIARYFQIMGAWIRHDHPQSAPNEWEYALEAYWGQFIPEGSTSIPRYKDPRKFFTLDDA